jgi:hypothetical protein
LTGSAALIATRTPAFGAGAPRGKSSHRAL